MKSKNKIKIAIVGMGNISTKHIKAIKKSKNLKLVATCDKKNKNLNESVFDNLSSMLNSKKNIDLVSILTPSSEHFKQTMLCLKFKKHVVVEKPICMKLSQLQKIMKAEKIYKRKVFTVYQNRLNPLISKVKDIITNKKLGEIILFNSTLYWNRNDKYYLNSRWRGRRKDDGGVAMNQGIHNLDLFQYFFGKVKSVFVEKKKIKKYLECEDTAIITLKFKNGIIGNFSLSTAVNNENYSNSIEIFSLKNNIKLYGKNLNILDFKQKTLFYKNENELHYEFYKMVCSTIMYKTKNFFSNKSVLHSMEMVHAINKSIKTGKRSFV
tara:strand:+ start:1553 stop:2521 length:969 start_codon:yes stop_codon:yes gene_type:complete